MSQPKYTKEQLLEIAAHCGEGTKAKQIALLRAEGKTHREVHAITGSSNSAISNTLRIKWRAIQAGKGTPRSHVDVQERIRILETLFAQDLSNKEIAKAMDWRPDSFATMLRRLRQKYPEAKLKRQKSPQQKASSKRLARFALLEQYLAEGMSHVDIAAKLGISVYTLPHVLSQYRTYKESTNVVQ